MSNSKHKSALYSFVRKCFFGDALYIPCDNHIYTCYLQGIDI